MLANHSIDTQVILSVAYALYCLRLYAQPDVFLSLKMFMRAQLKHCSPTGMFPLPLGRR